MTDLTPTQEKLRDAIVEAQRKAVEDTALQRHCTIQNSLSNAIDRATSIAVAHLPAKEPNMTANEVFGVMPCCGARLVNPPEHNLGCKHHPLYKELAASRYEIVRQAVEEPDYHFLTGAVAGYPRLSELTGPDVEYLLRAFAESLKPPQEKRKMAVWKKGESPHSQFAIDHSEVMLPSPPWRKIFEFEDPTETKPLETK